MPPTQSPFQVVTLFKAMSNNCQRGCETVASGTRTHNTHTHARAHNAHNAHNAHTHAHAHTHARTHECTYTHTTQTHTSTQPAIPAEHPLGSTSKAVSGCPLSLLLCAAAIAVSAMRRLRGRCKLALAGQRIIMRAEFCSRDLHRTSHVVLATPCCARRNVVALGA